MPKGKKQSVKSKGETNLAFEDSEETTNIINAKSKENLNELKPKLSKKKKQKSDKVSGS